MVVAAATLNNLGVSCLAARDFRQSLDYFRDALRHAIEDVNNNNQDDDDNNNNNNVGNNISNGLVNGAAVAVASLVAAANHDHTPSRPTGMPATTTATARPRSPLEEMHPGSRAFVHLLGFNLIPVASAYSTDSLISEVISTSIIVFNLGLVNHLRALEESPGSMARLAKATTLYQASLALLVEAGLELQMTGNPILDVLCMALFNNLGHASFELSSYEQSKEYFCYCLRFAGTVHPAHYGDQVIATTVDRVKNDFMLNASILTSPSFAAAA